MIINLQNMRNLRKRFPQIRLIEMARIEMEVSMSDIFLMPRSPRLILPVLLPTRSKPLLQQRYFSPYPIPVDLITQAQLRMKPTALDVLGHDIFPHEANTTQPGPLIGTDIEGEVVSGSSDEAPIRFMSAGYQEFVPSAA